MKTALLALVAIATMAAAPGFAAGPRVNTPQPAKAVAEGLYVGRWYEIARIPNSLQRDCQAATSDFLNFSSGKFKVVQTCRRGAVNGPRSTQNARGAILPNSRNAKIRMAFFGGAVSQEYWILDRADNNSWAIMATPGKNYLWLLSRTPRIDQGTRARIVGRISQMGYDTGRLQFPDQPAA